MSSLQEQILWFHRCRLFARSEVLQSTIYFLGFSWSTDRKLSVDHEAPSSVHVVRDSAVAMGVSVALLPVSSAGKISIHHFLDITNSVALPRRFARAYHIPGGGAAKLVDGRCLFLRGEGCSGKLPCG